MVKLTIQLDDRSSGTDICLHFQDDEMINQNKVKDLEEDQLLLASIERLKKIDININAGDIQSYYSESY
ncbi:MAG: hypothetical protein IKF29_10930 [Oceanobacillus sp.]|nr:hypothetical protein [Oceanobacillus sp.]